MKELKIEDNILVEKIDDENIFTVKFHTSDFKIKTYVYCKKKDKFIEILEQFYEENPKFKYSSKYYYIFDGKKIENLDQTLEELKIGKNSNIQVKADDEDEELSVLFLSTDNKINTAIACKNSSTFSQILEKLYEKHPQFKDNGYFYVCEGKQIEKQVQDKTLKELKIKDKSNILVNKLEMENE